MDPQGAAVAWQTCGLPSHLDCILDAHGDALVLHPRKHNQTGEYVLMPTLVRRYLEIRQADLQ